MTTKILAPWSNDQVDKLNEFQTCGRMHPFTCGSGHRSDMRHSAIADALNSDLGQLIATRQGWVCPACSYAQHWAHDFMLNGAPPDSLGRPLVGRPGTVIALRRVVKEKLQRLEGALPPGPWKVWSSNSFRRIGGPTGADGDVLHAYRQRSDGHTDLSMPENQLEALVELRNQLPGLINLLHMRDPADHAELGGRTEADEYFDRR
jgi:hypothetical protein